MLKFINSSLPIEKAVLQAELQTISPKINFTCPLKSIYNSDVFISVQKRPLKGLHTCQKLSFPIDKASSEQRYHNALLADFVYNRDFTILEATQWGIDRELARFVSKMTNIKLYPQDGLLEDSHTGLVAYIFRNKVEREIRLVFGGTTSGHGVSGGAPSYIKNINNFIKQCEANVHNVFGGVPACYKQAVQLMHNLQQLVQMDGEWNGYRLSTSGHSLGGGLAAYAALKVSSKENVILAECFSSAQFGRGLQRDLLKQHGSVDLEKAMHNVNHHYVEGDVIPKMDKFFAVGHIGKINIIPQATNKKDNFLAAHSNYVKHSLIYALQT